MGDVMGDKFFDICIIGGGAAGLAAAVSASEGGVEKGRILLLEKNPEVGKKLSATGNGRGNLSNLKCVDWEKTLGFFSSIGLMTKTDEEGRIYPCSEDAKDITERLKTAAIKRGVEIWTSSEVAAVEINEAEQGEEAKFTLSIKRKVNKAEARKAADESKGEEDLDEGSEEISVRCKKLLIAMGGKAAPFFGSTGDGYRIAKSLGHRITRLAPSLTPVETVEDTKAMGIDGVRADALVTLYKDGKEVVKEEGQVQFTDYGLSGICIFNLSSEMKIDEGEKPEDGLKRYSIGIDLAPRMSEEEVSIWISDRIKEGDVEEEVLCSLINKKLAIAIKNSEGGVTSGKVKDLRFGVSGLKGWEKAQVTRGGVSLAEVDMVTMESKLIPGLFFAGEVLDYSGPCGGYNLQFAWTTGAAAGRGIASGSGIALDII